MQLGISRRGSRGRLHDLRQQRITERIWTQIQQNCASHTPKTPTQKSGEQHHASQNISTTHRSRPRHLPWRADISRHTHYGRGCTGTGSQRYGVGGNHRKTWTYWTRYGIRTKRAQTTHKLPINDSMRTFGNDGNNGRGIQK